MSVVLFSGGCDSTHVLYNLAMKKLTRNDNEPTYERILALSINHEQIPAKEKQKIARERIKEEFKKRELLQYVQFVEINITTENAGEGIRISDGLSQPNIWLPTSVLYAKQKDTIYLGYHKGDDYWQLKYEAESAMKNFLLVMGKKEVTLEYPLINMTKADIIRDLKDRGLYDLCWYCERDVAIADGPCGTCWPCKVHKTALLQIEHNLDKPYGNNYILGDSKPIRKEDIKAVSIPIDKDSISVVSNLVDPGKCVSEDPKEVGETEAVK